MEIVVLLFCNIFYDIDQALKHYRVQDSYEEQEFWMTRLDWVGIRINQFEMFGEHENCLSRWIFFVLDENSVEWKPYMNRESKSLELTI